MTLLDLRKGDMLRSILSNDRYYLICIDVWIDAENDGNNRFCFMQSDGKLINSKQVSTEYLTGSFRSFYQIFKFPQNIT